MTFHKTNAGFVLRFDKGEELVRVLSEFCAKQNIGGAWISGIGGAMWADLAFYHLERKAYEYDRIDEPLEITSLMGNVSLVNNKPHIHLHATVSDMDYHAYGGHLKELAVAATCEVNLVLFEQPIERVHNDSVGLKIFDFRESA